MAGRPLKPGAPRIQYMQKCQLLFYLFEKRTRKTCIKLTIQQVIEPEYFIALPMENLGHPWEGLLLIVCNNNNEKLIFFQTV